MIAAPLFDLLKKGVKWQWHVEQEVAHQQAKEALANALVLGHPIVTECNYSVTEREALVAKEAFVKFQTFIEGESITLITDHAALMWV